MRYLTPAIDTTLALFKRCYERRWNGFGAPTWQLVALPAAGALGDQDAWTMEALAFARDVWNRLEHDLYEAALKRERKDLPVPIDAQEFVDG